MISRIFVAWFVRPLADLTQRTICFVRSPQAAKTKDRMAQSPAHPASRSSETKFLEFSKFKESSIRDFSTYSIMNHDRHCFEFMWLLALHFNQLVAAENSNCFRCMRGMQLFTLSTVFILIEMQSTLGTSRNLEDPISYVWHVPWHNYCIRTWTNLQWCILCDKQGYQDPRH